MGKEGKTSIAMKKSTYQRIAVIFAAIFILSSGDLKSQTYRILPLGNSITQGDRFSDGANSYRRNLWNKLIGDGHIVDFVGSLSTDRYGFSFPDGTFDHDHEGHWGYRADEIIPSLPGWLAGYDPDIALIHIGTNDAYDGNSASSTIDEIEQIIDILRNKNAGITIFLAQLIPMPDADHNNTIDAINAGIPNIASSLDEAGSRIIVVDHNSGWNIGSNTYDGIHPNETGEEVMAQKWFEAFDAYVSAIPNVPSGFALSGETSTTIDLSWSDNSSNESGFEIERSHTSSSDNFAWIHTTAAGTTSYTDNGLDNETEYFYRIRAINATGPSLYTSVESATTLPAPPAAPTGLSATAIDENTIDLTWTDTNNENSYTIERSLTSGTGFTTVTSISANTTYYRDGSVDEGTRYYYRIYATNPGGDSDYSSEASATTNLAAPTNLTASAVDEQSIQLTWTDVSTHETGYRVERSETSGSGYSQIHLTSASVNSYLNEGLEDDKEYFYRVRATNGVDNSDYSNVASATTDLSIPSAPTGLNFTDITTSSIRLNWDDLSDNEEGFQIRRSPTLTGTYTVIHTTAENVETFNNTSLNDDTEYFYRVNAVNDAGPSTYISGSATTLLSPPAAPGNLNFSNITTSSIQINWSDLSDNEDGFEIRRAEDLAGPYLLVNTTAENAVSYNDTGLDEETTYFYRVNSINTSGPSAFISGNATTLLSIPDAPIGLNFTDVTTSSIRLNWDDQSDNEDGFEIRRSLTLSGTYVLIHTTAENIETYNNTDLNDDTEYFYRVNAVNDAGPSASISGSERTLLAVPDAPSNLKGDATNICSVELTWKDNADNEDGFEIYRRVGLTGTYVLVETLPADSESYTDTDTQNGTTYHYRVNAFNDAGPSAVVAVDVFINVILNGGTIGPDQVICPGGDPALIQNLGSPSGGSNNWTYQWQSRIASAEFTDIDGATGLTYDPPAGMMGIKEFQRVSTVECGSVPSNTVTITAEDLEDPVFTSCPEDMILVVERNETTGEVVTPDPAVTDNCGIILQTWSMTGATVASSPVTGINSIGTYIFNLGVTTITYHAEDLAGNFAECSFDVTVEVKKPEIEGVTIDNSSMKIGDVVTATITVADDGGSGYSLISGSVGGYLLDTENLVRNNSTTYYATFTIEEGGNSYLASQSIPVANVIVSDGTDQSLAYSGFIVQNMDAIDAKRPVIQSMTVLSGNKKVGDVVTLNIDADEPGYTIREDSSFINGIAVSEPNVTFSDLGSGNYRLSYIVEEGDNDVGSGELTASVILVRPSGNVNLPYSIVGNSSQLTIDAHSPVITRMEVPDEEVGVGGIVQVSIVADSTDYSAVAGTTINGVPLDSPRVNFTERTGGLYELTYTVDPGDDVVPPGMLQISVVLEDPAGNESTAYTKLASNTLEIYTELPTAVLAGSPEICEGESTEFSVYLQGRDPWSFYLYDGSDTTKFLNITESRFDFTIAPEASTNFSIPVVKDRNGVQNTGSGSINVTVYEKTDVEIVNLASGYSVEADPVRLQANVSGGVFSGPGVIMIGGVPYFDPGIADTVTSPHTILYNYTNVHGCTSQASKLVFVLGAQGAVYIPSNVACSNGEPFEVNASNVAGVNGSFRLLNSSSLPVAGLTDRGDNSAEIDPALLVPGTYTIEYAYFDEVMLYIRKVFEVENVVIPVMTNLQDDSYCQNVEPFLLESNVANTMFEGPAVSILIDGYMFDPGEAAPGPITITATVVSENGCRASSQKEVEILFAPKTKFSIDKACIAEGGGSVSFENLTNGKLSIETWNWNFDDPESGDNNYSDLINPKHFYSVAGERSISLTATTFDGCVDTYVMDTLIGNMPVADFTLLSDCFANGAGIKFIDRSTSISSPMDSLVWTFATSSGGILGEIRSGADTDTVAFPFVSVDQYQVSLAAINSMGCVDTVSREIALRPTVRLTAEGYEEQFNVSGTAWSVRSNDGIESWTWDVPDFDEFEPTQGDKAWFTQLPAGVAGYLERSWIQSPCFDFTQMGRPVIKLDIMKSFFPNLNGAVLQYMDINEEGWKTIGANNQGINWYNMTGLINQPGGSSMGWGLNVFSPDNDWVTAIHDLNDLAGNPNVTFRIAIATTGSQSIGNQGFAFDNIAIRERSKRAVLEHFTNSSDATSKSADDVIDAYAKTYSKDVIDLQYHMSYPGTDPMNANNPNPPSNREFFYGIPQVPYAILDGGVESLYRYDFSDLKTTPDGGQINTLTLEFPSFDIDLDVDWLEGSMDVTTTVTCLADQYMDNIQLYLVVFESLVTAYTGNNGDEEFRNVVLDMLPSPAGSLLGNNWYKGKVDERTNSWFYAPYVEDVEDLGVVAFVQDRNTGRILQAAVNYKNPLVGIGRMPKEIGPLHVYPNPARNRFFVNLGMRTEDDGMIRLTDMSGRVVLSEFVPSGYQIYQVDIHHLNHGVYILHWIESGKPRGVGKIVKAR